MILFVGTSKIGQINMALKVSDKEVLCRVKARKKKVTNFRNSQKMPLKVGIHLPNVMSSLRPIWDFFNEVIKSQWSPSGRRVWKLVERGKRGASEVLIMFYLLLLVVVTWGCSLCTIH